MKRYLLAMMASVMVVGFVLAEEFTLQITAIDADGTVTGRKIAVGKAGKGGGFGKGEEVTVKVSSNVKVHKGKFDMEAKGYAADGDDLKLAGLKTAIMQAQNGSVMVAGKSISDKDSLELSVRDGKPMAKLNGKDIPFTDVSVKGKGPLMTRVTTGDDGVATTVLITPGGGIGAFGKGKAKAKADN